MPAEHFAELLTEAIHRIRLRESKSVQVVQDELGYALGREGGTAIHYWRKGHIPAKQEEIGELAQALVRRGRLERAWLAAFLESAGYYDHHNLVQSLFPHTSDAPTADTPANPIPSAPFIAGPPLTQPRHFFGRQRELRRIFGLLKRFPLQNTAVIGPYRSGKTSLLHYLQAITRTPANELRPNQHQDWLPHAADYQWVFVDFQDARMGHQESLLRHILHNLGLPIPTPCDLTHFMDVVSQQLQRPSVILMDEIGAGLASADLDQSFWWSLRSLSSNQTKGNLAFVLAAHEPPAQLAHEVGKPSPFFNIFGHTFHLGPLTEEEALELVATTPRPFPSADVAWMLETSGRWPSLLQILCHTRLAALEEGDEEDWQAEALAQMAPFRALLGD